MKKTSPKMHAKSLLVDEKILYIGSINFSQTSFDQNKELGVLITDPKLINKFFELFQKDKD